MNQPEKKRGDIFILNIEFPTNIPSILKQEYFFILYDPYLNVIILALTDRIIYLANHLF